jgi:Holliday junction resolvase RusA-like endonuclease
MTLEFFICTEPIGKGRPRVSTIGDRPVLFTPEKTVNSEAEIRVWLRQLIPNHIPFDGPVEIQFYAYVERSNAAAKRAYPTGKPDLDNIEKLLFDAFNGIVWVDDAQVVQVEKGKRFANALNEVGFSVVVKQLLTREQNNPKGRKKAPKFLTEDFT